MSDKKNRVPRVYSCPRCGHVTYYSSQEEFQDVLAKEEPPCEDCKKVFEALPILDGWLTSVIEKAVSEAIAFHERSNKHEADPYNYY